MAKLDTNKTASVDSYIDWTGCELVERIPGKVSGRPLVRGTRILADTIVQDAELGSPLEEIHENKEQIEISNGRMTPNHTNLRSAKTTHGIYAPHFRDPARKAEQTEPELQMRKKTNSTSYFS